ncbi:RSP4/6 / flagellar radial spoke protein [Leishmania donovani]|uniref:Flagellar_radial_spoke_protein_-_putative n=3 Tax=Leishmania donovani species complex TaxID=38574 RepID=A0A6L0WMC2_LEIIN|nr:putative flagellar radial spoke protein [Leishmania infantum JPCM5]CAC9465190.1 flagellar_radial_spoke_protein_-_putative [Leishmania infantum]CAJ1987134.1 RSP4/6 / flagellar radial spoke protein [Leishmania donovani]CAM66432.1 putative flagellar radial spoke protein [Leishmania infantum JPCM5]SUZ40092.1 flagellar_radial_spoke_protein_-_putative [Leishmania infantum]VDZ43023.1 flagellar_radial_spoke_protein_putative/GeneDB:LmjF.13.0430 [Leishmania donovani]|eukprot:XP_001464057.1 putative flagellar radial spoke protein [Leishmania infantum JPCM5]
MASTALSAAELEAQFANAKAYLMRADKDGVSAYDQLTRLMELLLEENPENVAGDPSKLHEILSFIQTHSFACGESTSACYEATQVPAEELRRFEDNKKLFDLPAPEVRTVIEQPDPYTTITTTTVVPLKAPSFESVAAQNKYWTAAGCGLADEEAFLLDRSITNLAMEKNLQDIKFFGKIFGTHSDYFVLRTRRYLEAGETVYVETNTMGKPPRKKGMVPVQAEPGYVGVNRYTFWVTASPSDKWEKLPDVTPQQINAARETKRFFTGDLSASVAATFPWGEAAYLRAQLARITSSTTIAPQGALEEPEPEQETEEDEDEDAEDGAQRKPKEAKYKPLVVPSPDYGEEEVDVAQLTIDRWVHAEGYIYKNGRQTKVPEKPEPEEGEGEGEEEAEPEPAEPEADAQGEEEEEEGEPEEDEEVELFAPIQNDHLYGVVDIPQPPPAINDEDEEEEEEPEEEGEEERGEPDNTPLKPLRDDDVPDDDPTKMKIACWTMRVENNVSKAHRMAVVQSLRWPGATAYAAEGGKRWSCVYFGNGMKKTDAAFTPPPAPPVQSECADITEVEDPTATVEKLVRRGEEIPEADSEAEPDELEEEEDS